MTILDAIIQGILQGLAEFLPISSSGHLSVYQHFAGITDQALSATVFLHLGTLFAVFAVFYKQLWELIAELGLTIKDIFTGKFRLKDMTPRRRMLIMLILSCLMLAVILPVKDQIEGLVGDGDIIVEGVCLLFTAVLILIGSRLAVPKNSGKTAGNMRAGDAVLIGLAQAVATLPGVSRSGSTISASLMLGYDREYAFDYSFILGTPAVLLATALEIKDAVQGNIEINVLPVFIGIAIAAVVGYFAIKFLAKTVRSGAFRYFGWYCTVVGLLVIAAGLTEKISGQPLGALLGLQ
ncbi:MAG TPA: undecaprenyl-diphosphate phosphatase [Oscillospiraceae bacterium]|nr:undecaprenyl-diphosphate phosphatase [Oscillospiraceae bacterium]HPF57086.1 undecaprenyl-diphosphate phosphatase [Clostridiales bacterium]HPK36486.1 undecaprenyl-diphosphate phosphatase [Oscillospiraceae bacterium]HPR76454.1 undecaprenyl-diphosphate phosphatase [Oscillospiraceae bacterium]